MNIETDKKYTLDHGNNANSFSQKDSGKEI